MVNLSWSCDTISFSDPVYILLLILVHPIYLSINLWMISCTCSQLSAHQSKNFLPKITHESTISITYNALGEPTQSKDFFETKISHFAELKYDVTEKKWVNFFNLSTTTYMQSLPKYLGKPVMKSIEILSYFCSGMGNGFNKPAGHVSYDFFVEIP